MLLEAAEAKLALLNLEIKHLRDAPHFCCPSVSHLGKVSMHIEAHIYKLLDKVMALEHETARLGNLDRCPISADDPVAYPFPFFSGPAAIDSEMAADADGVLAVNLPAEIFYGDELEDPVGPDVVVFDLEGSFALACVPDRAGSSGDDALDGTETCVDESFATTHPFFVRRRKKLRPRILPDSAWRVSSNSEKTNGTDGDEQLTDVTNDVKINLSTESCGVKELARALLRGAYQRMAQLDMTVAKPAFSDVVVASSDILMHIADFLTYALQEWRKHKRTYRSAIASFELVGKELMQFTSQQLDPYQIIDSFADAMQLKQVKHALPALDPVKVLALGSVEPSRIQVTTTSSSSTEALP